MTEAALRPVVAVILAGGAGTRLWPLARASNPKQFLPLLGGDSLFQRTSERIAPLVGRERLLVVTGSRHRDLVRRQAPRIPSGNIIGEALGRNTACSIALAAHRILSRHPDALMVVLPADHWIAPTQAFRASLRHGLRFLRAHDELVVLGVPALAAETGYGYIRPREPLAPGLRRVGRFVEKPSRAAATRLIRRNGCLWNSGIFLWRASTFLAELNRHCPEVARPVARWALRAPAGVWTVPASMLRRVPSIPVDKAVLEASERVAVMKAPFGWSDVGTWESYLSLIRKRRDRAGTGEVIHIDAGGSMAVNPGGLTVFVGVRDVVAVRSGHAVLVCRRGSAQGVRKAVRRLRGRLADYR